MAISTYSGQQLGMSKDLCIDPDGVRLGALVIVRPGIWRTSQMLYWQDVKEITASCLMVESDQVLRPIGEIPSSWWSTHREPGVWGRRLQAPDGRLIGLVSDLLIDRRGQVVGCRVSDGLFKDLVDGQPRLVAQVTVTSDGQGLTLESGEYGEA